MNPASRLLTLYDLIVADNNERTIIHMWADKFSIDQKSPHLEDDVVTCLSAVKDQVDMVKARLQAHDVPSTLLEPGFSRLRETVSPSHIRRNWKELKGNIQRSECRASFAWAGWVLREEDEEEMSIEAFDGLQAELMDLEASLDCPQLSPYLREFIQRQIDTIRAALRVYPINGIKPLDDAMRKVAGDFTFEKPHVDRERSAAPGEAQGIFSKAASFIQRTAQTCDDINKIGKTVEYAKQIGAAVGPYLLVAAKAHSGS